MDSMLMCPTGWSYGLKQDRWQEGKTKVIKLGKAKTPQNQKIFELLTTDSFYAESHEESKDKLELMITNKFKANKFHTDVLHKATIENQSLPISERKKKVT